MEESRPSRFDGIAHPFRFDGIAHPFGLFKVYFMRALTEKQAFTIAKILGMQRSELDRLGKDPSHLLDWMSRHKIDGDFGITRKNVDTLFKYTCEAGVCNETITNLVFSYKRFLGLDLTVTKQIAERYESGNSASQQVKVVQTAQAEHVTQQVNIYQMAIAKEPEKDYPAGSLGISLRLDDKIEALKKTHRDRIARLSAEELAKIRKIKAQTKREKKRLRAEYEQVLNELETQAEEAKRNMEEEKVEEALLEEKRRKRREKKKRKAAKRKRIKEKLRRRSSRGKSKSSESLDSGSDLSDSGSDSEDEYESRATMKTVTKIQAVVATAPSNDVCPVCDTRKKNVVFGPCGHGACSECSSILTVCSTCKRAVAQKVKIDR